MKRISIENVEAGMKVARDIYDNKGTLLLKAGVVLNRYFIERLEAISVTAVYVETPGLYTPDYYPEDIVSEQMRGEITSNIERVFQKCQTADNLDIGEISYMTKKLLESILSNGDVVMQTADIKVYDDYTFAHSVNVCVLSVMLGLMCGYTKPQLLELAMGAMLHDIGKIKIPLKILNKPDQLNDEEFDEIREHPKRGFNILREKSNISLKSMHIALQHHEKFDGSGYPRHLKGTDIHEYARIVAIADVFDALTANRAYRQACPIHKAYEIMMQEGDSHYDMNMLEAFFNCVAIYPIGTVLELSSGYYAVVIEVKKNFTTQPVIRIIADANKIQVYNSLPIDMRYDKSQQIVRVLSEAEFLDICALNRE